MNRTFLIGFSIFAALLAMIVFQRETAVMPSKKIDALSVDLSYAPRSVVVKGKKFVPVDILSNNVEWRVDQELANVEVKAILKFQVQEKGFPLFLLNPNSKVFIEGVEKPIQEMTEAEFQLSQYYGVLEEKSPGQSYEIEFRFDFVHDSQKEKYFLPHSSSLNSGNKTITKQYGSI